MIRIIDIKLKVVVYKVHKNNNIISCQKDEYMNTNLWPILSSIKNINA